MISQSPDWYCGQLWVWHIVCGDGLYHFAFCLVILGYLYSEIDQTYLSIEAQCVSHHYPRWTATIDTPFMILDSLVVITRDVEIRTVDVTMYIIPNWTNPNIFYISVRGEVSSAVLRFYPRTGRYLVVYFGSNHDYYPNANIITLYVTW